MKVLRPLVALLAAVLVVTAASPAHALANRVFVSARSGNNANSCDNVCTPCQTFAGAVAQLSAGGEAIVLDSGGYGPVTITQAVTIEAPAGVTAFIHPASGDAITINAPGATVTLRGLVLNGGPNHGIAVNSVGALTVEDCFITGFANDGIHVLSGGRLNLRGTSITACSRGVDIATTGVVQASVDRCHLDGNSHGYIAATASPGSSTTTATYSTANNNSSTGWWCGDGSSTGLDVINLEFCAGSENGVAGIVGSSSNSQSVARYSNCAFANNGNYGVYRFSSGTFESRGNNTMTGNGIAPTYGGVGSFSPM